MKRWARLTAFSAASSLVNPSKHFCLLTASEYLKYRRPCSSDLRALGLLSASKEICHASVKRSQSSQRATHPAAMVFGERPSRPLSSTKQRNIKALFSFAIYLHLSSRDGPAQIAIIVDKVSTGMFASFA